jgi:hypothetical protein
MSKSRVPGTYTWVVTCATHGEIAAHVTNPDAVSAIHVHNVRTGLYVVREQMVARVVPLSPLQFEAAAIYKSED